MLNRVNVMIASSALAAALTACTAGPTGAPGNATPGSNLISNNNGALTMTLSNGSSYSTQAVSGAPVINHVLINFNKVQIHYDGTASASAPTSASADSDPNWLDFNASASQTIDLVNMAKDTTFGAMTNLKNGTYTQIRLAVNSAEVDYTDTNGNAATASLDVSSGDLKIIKPFTLSADQKTILHFDFDTNNSVKQDGPGGTWRMNPTAVHTVATYVPVASTSTTATTSTTP